VAAGTVLELSNLSNDKDVGYNTLGVWLPQIAFFIS
jgi:hypothetical protein